MKCTGRGNTPARSLHFSDCWTFANPYNCCTRMCACIFSACTARVQIFGTSPPDSPEPAYCTVYNHLVKSGGTSIKEQLVASSMRENSRSPGDILDGPYAFDKSSVEAVHGCSMWRVIFCCGLTKHACRRRRDLQVVLAFTFLR